MKRFTKSSQARESATRSRDLGCSLETCGPRWQGCGQKAAQRAEQCARQRALHTSAPCIAGATTTLGHRSRIPKTVLSRFFSLTHNWLKVQVGQNLVQFFNFSAIELNAC